MKDSVIFRPVRQEQASESLPRPRQRSSAVTRVDCDRAIKGTGAEWFVNIWQGETFSTYWLLPLACPEGIAYQFQCSRTQPASEYQSDHYDVALFLDGQTCECPGFLRWGGTCKHIAALKLLIEQGKLSLPEATPLTSRGSECCPDDWPF